ncbi:MAG: pyridoxamine 5'-phosphate oxidase family protein [Methylohalobius sp. ZOD2]
MSEIYGEQQRAMQAAFETEALADRLNEVIVASEISDPHKAFIEGRDMFFLTTVDHRGYPTCSYKGGEPGFVRVVDRKTLAFPSFNGNGMFLSLGNMGAHDKIGMLFIDFETPHRVRVHGRATISDHDPLMREIPGAELLVRVTVDEIFVNCPRYIHRYRKIAASRYVPKADCPAPPPQWKRIDGLQDALPERDKKIATSLGGEITPEEYEEMIRQGEA